MLQVYQVLAAGFIVCRFDLDVYLNQQHYFFSKEYGPISRKCYKQKYEEPMQLPLAFSLFLVFSHTYSNIVVSFNCIFQICYQNTA